MKQVLLQEPGRFHLAEASPPSPRTGEALVRVRRVGVCGTDLHAFAGQQPFFSFPRILGHEIAVEVIECPPNGRGLAAGDRCAVEPYLACGRCHACKLDRPNCCQKLQVLGVNTDGGMREWMSLPLDHLYKSDKLSLDQLALVEPLGIGAHAVTRSGLVEGDQALVVGAGPIGLAVAQFARAVGARVRVRDVSPSRRAFASSFGFETVAEPDAALADVVFDATGNATAMEQSLSQVAHGGRLIFVGLVQGTVALDDPLFHRREVTLLASRNSLRQFPRVIRLMEQGRINILPWLTHRMSLGEVPDRFPRILRDPTCMKAIVEVNETSR